MAVEARWLGISFWLELEFKLDHIGALEDWSGHKSRRGFWKTFTLLFTSDKHTLKNGGIDRAKKFFGTEVPSKKA